MKEDIVFAESPIRMLTVRALSELLNCSQRHVYRQAENGKIPAPIKIGALNRWSAKVINQWIAAGCPPVSVEQETETGSHA